ncbi:glycosyltransferase family 2 protein [Pseudactinotalea suaedae]|uniref:glycosyltransferase family 2 protein n=1 Tax=Pseudactinotalea suaedae TaxID=1524924 RepID=UPI0012E25A6E|nr:glycosyltransferase family 2 protein [Pseudactinotalea suaedae]
MTVSVVIPVRDDADQLAGCLAALARQSVLPAEVVVVDNASTDGSAAVAAEHGARVVVEPAVGIAPAAATGYDAARSTIIARLDADSRPPADWVEQIVGAMDRHPDVGAVTGNGEFHDLAPGLGAVVARAYLGAYYLLGHAAAANHVLWGSSMAMRREVWWQVRDRVHRSDPDIHDDLDLSLALGAVRVLRMPSLVVGVSARSVRGAAQMRRRFRRAFRTLRLGWEHAPPWERWAARLGLGARGRARLEQR